MAISIFLQFFIVFSTSLGGYFLMVEHQQKNSVLLGDRWMCEYELHSRGRVGSLRKNIEEIAKAKHRNSNGKHEQIDAVTRSLFDSTSLFVGDSLVSTNCEQIFGHSINIQIYKRGDGDHANQIPKFSYRLIQGG